MAYVKQKIPTNRILQIVKRLYALERLQSTELSEEYDVSSRTIHRDMLKISEVIPLKNNLGIWQLDTEQFSNHNNHFHQALLSSFAHNLEIEVECLEKSNISKENIAYAIDYKHLPKNLGEQIIKCIEMEEKCLFMYVKEKESSQREVDPIKIYTENGRWYIIARDHKDNKVKYFNLSKIKHFRHLKGQGCTLTRKMIDDADNMKSIWSSMGGKATLVRLYVKPEIAHYIRDIKLHKSQIIADEHHDGGLEVHCTITHKLELLPQIKYWLPRVHVLEPKWLWEDIMRDLEIYGDESVRFDI